MATIEEMESKMTIYYKKRNGEIKMLLGGIQNMDTFGDDKEDYSLIWDYKVYERDVFVMNNVKMFKIDIEDNFKIVMKEEYKKY